MRPLPWVSVELGWLSRQPRIRVFPATVVATSEQSTTATGAGSSEASSEARFRSDLAGLQTKAVRDGDEWVISGQKVWTSEGQHADYGMLIARTDPDASKHRGISWFAFPMDQQGVEIRPLREMTGRSLFNEVFIDEARVSHSDVIGDLNEGWRVANFKAKHLDRMLPFAWSKVLREDVALFSEMHIA